MRSGGVYGGTVDVMIGTPGRIIEHIKSTDGFKARLKGCEVLILDEVDMYSCNPQ